VAVAVALAIGIIPLSHANVQLGEEHHHHHLSPPLKLGIAPDP